MDDHSPRSRSRARKHSRRALFATTLLMVPTLLMFNSVVPASADETTSTTVAPTDTTTTTPTDTTTTAPSTPDTTVPEATPPAPPAEPGSACEQTHLESIDSGGAHFLPGETVSVNGRGFAPSCGLRMVVNLPDGTTEQSIAATNESGDLTFAYTLGFATGEYSVQAETPDGSISLAMASFRSGVYVTSDRNDYAPGDTATFSGRGFDAVMALTEIPQGRSLKFRS